MPDPSSRRRFLFGRSQTQEDGWLKFLAQLRRSCEGEVKPISAQAGRLVPKRLDDVLQARALCAAHGVCLALSGLPLPPADESRPVLWVQAGSAWGSLMPLGDTDCWRVQAGCPIAGMQAAELIGHSVSDSIENLAQWLAVVARHDMNLSALGLVSVEWLFADGTIEVLGAFGSRDSQPLRSLRAQQTIPKLFEYLSEPVVQEALAAKRWPWVFRLDALKGVEINLAHLVLGHGGALGWLIAATFDKRVVVQSGGSTQTAEMVQEAGLIDTEPTIELDARVKAIMDPEGLFLSVPAQKR